MYNIDVTKLSRDYVISPLKNGEILCAEDLYYLVIELNLPIKQIATYLNRGVKYVYRAQKTHNIYKTQQQKNACYKNTCQQKYGVDNTSKLTQVRQQIKDSWNNLDEEQKQQIITKRASTWNSSSVEHKKHKTQALKQTWETKDKQIFSQTIKLQKQQRSEQEKLTTSNKLRQMWNNRSAEDRNKIKCKIKSTWNNKTAQEKKIITDKFKNKLPQTLQKTYNTKKLNKTFNKSKCENEIHSLLQTLYTNVQTQYKCEKYPFACDFFIPELNLYIEYQGTWTHGGQPFDSQDIGCQLKLQKWIEKAKTSKFYENAIKNWTITDVQKRNIAKNNELKYMEFFTMDEFYMWFNQQQGASR